MIMTNKFIRKREKIKAQVKSRFYYWFWGAMAGAVVGGQLYVGSSYRQMARSMDRWFEETIEMIQIPLKPPTGRMMPVPMPNPDFYDDPMIIR
ncbi:hypothetical protein HOT69_gp108 [Cyanophage S-TIM4]|uniref:Uncharacterized protein n=2 Tax=Thaumasvirus stim4 TaxID=2734148 RepID=A0A345AWL2_9CAUD|nr:hypothetical protein PRSM4_165 [Prochlorococcus phage P-RSM4]YP_009806416.1 hypothetical protein HOT69_gp108 [Cyanophage S-TIM4]ADO98548.1 hypothetical protein PRSM4_165 [Prochlorococcus phage P-RSM4]AXF41295.1 unknown [Cyanophage S-TIM4]|tara:strand:- start:2332 stop:2610 length:279 start_codon:yes stop_codon:yes gene_type:complete